ncbi:MAG: 30S ribosomal protein S14 [Candidatus Nasuia deltocephalinicola]
MSKLSVLERSKKRFFLFIKYNNKYNFLKFSIKKNIKNKNFNNANMINNNSFQYLPRNSNFTRLRNRCYLTGRPRGVFRRFNLARSVIRDLSFKGFIPGVIKSCW